MAVLMLRFLTLGSLCLFILNAASAQTIENPPKKPDEIVVAAKRLTVETTIDRKIYTVSDDALAEFGNASDVLNQIPSIDVDVDGNVALRGDSNVLILVDGKPSARFQGASAGDNLLAMSAVEIERIEVMTTPPAQYNAEGVSGVINIITRKQQHQDSQGSLAASVGNDHRANTSLNQSLARPWGSVQLGLGYREDLRLRQTLSETDQFTTYPALPSKSMTSMSETIHRHIPTFNASTSWHISESNELSLATSGTHRDGLRTYAQTTQDSASSPTRRNSVGHDPETDTDETIHLIHHFLDSNAQWDASVHHSDSYQHEQYQYADSSAALASAVALSNLDFIEHHEQTEWSIDAQLISVHLGSFKFGAIIDRDQYSFYNSGNTYDNLTNSWDLNAALQNDYVFRQTISGLYVSDELKSTWAHVLIGLRAEFTSFDGVTQPGLLSVGQQYLKFFPNVHLDKPLSDNWVWTLGVSRRISRPNPSSYNPFVNTEYTPNLSAGNPSLRPPLTDNAESSLDFEHAGFNLSANAYFSRNLDAVTDVVSVLADGLSLSTKENIALTKSMGVELASRLKIDSNVSASLSSNFFHSQFDATALGTPGLRTTQGINAKAKFDWHTASYGTWQLALYRNDKRLTPQGLIAPTQTVNLGYKLAISPNWSVVATGADLTNGRRYLRLTTTPSFSQSYERLSVGRIGYVGFVYSFGSNKRPDKSTNFDYDSGG